MAGCVAWGARPGYTGPGMKKADHDLLVGRTIAGKFVVEDLHRQRRHGRRVPGAADRAREDRRDQGDARRARRRSRVRGAISARGEGGLPARTTRTRSRSSTSAPSPTGLLYIAMEFLDGRSLHHVLREEWPLAPGAHRRHLDADARRARGRPRPGRRSPRPEARERHDPQRAPTTTGGPRTS